MFFSRQGGLEETRHVFIEGNDLPGRFAKAKQFVIGETGFGSGLNFIACVDTWLKTAPADARLHYISAEKHPFSKQDLSHALSVWPTLAYIIRELLEVYPPLVHGFHPRHLLAGRVSLTLLFGDALELLAELNASVDAWFLDGFSPAKNQSLWSDTLLSIIAERTVVGGSFATYTTAGDARRHLQSAGFSVHKLPGFGKKREMLAGRLDAARRQVTSAPWFYQAQASVFANRHAIVIGAGFAGITTASALAQRGWQITLIEQHATIANGASGNPAGVVSPRLTADMSLDARLYMSAFLYATSCLQQLQKQMGDIGWHADGVVQLLDSVKQQAIHNIGLPEAILSLLDEAGAGEAIGVSVNSKGVLYAQAGWLQPQRLCQAMLQQHPQKIRLLASTNIHDIKRVDGKWQLGNDSGVVATAPIVIVANGSEASRLLSEFESSIQAVRGQLSYSEGRSDVLRRPVCYDGYIIPMADRQYCIGASYDRGSRDMTLREKDQQDNLSALHKALPTLAYGPPGGGRVAFRASTTDHLPIVGPVPNETFYRHRYADLQHGRPAHRYPLAEYQPGLYVNTGHGSRGLTSCPLAAEIIASMLNAEPIPVPEDLRLAMHPARFIVRDLKRQASGE